MPAYLSWLENPVHTRSVIGSNPIAGTSGICELLDDLQILFCAVWAKICVISLFLRLVQGQGSQDKGKQGEEQFHSTQH